MSGGKKVVYLIGAGATQGEVAYLGAPINMLMANNSLGAGVSARVISNLTERERELLGTSSEIDIEKLVALSSACGVGRMSNLAEKLRRLYFQDLCSKIPAPILRRPTLAESLLQVHKELLQAEGVEELSCVISTNHDGLFQLASQRVFGGLNLGVPFESSRFRAAGNAPPILQVHGSFTWSFGLPISVEPISRSSLYSKDIGWIPPTVAKESKQFPFNKLTGLAYEYLSKSCDVLRVIGSSLTQNDWNILSLIFNAQKHLELTGGAPFRIELIMPRKTGQRIRDECSFLKKVAPIAMITDGDFGAYLDEYTEARDPETANPFAYWLKQKIQYHRRAGHLPPNAIRLQLAEVIGEAA
jgi:hypothetical protein